MSLRLHEASLDWITPDAERLIARHARVSTKDPDRGDYSKLLSYCIKHGHWSVFEQACASFEILTTRAISPQILRHRSFCFQETSQRYCDPLTVLGGLEEECTEFELRQQDTKNRQNSLSYEDGLFELVEDQFRKRITDVFRDAQDLYEDMLAAGVAKECARNILPMCTPTRLHMMGNIRSWIFYVGLRGACGTQKEHKDIALSVKHSLRELVPTVAAAVQEAALEGVSGLDGWK